ncbi:MAG: hypothetical protein WA774_01355, partial [Candidatus Acidiferrales bacterium]
RLAHSHLHSRSFGPATLPSRFDRRSHDFQCAPAPLCYGQRERWQAHLSPLENFPPHVGPEKRWV